MQHHLGIYLNTSVFLYFEKVRTRTRIIKEFENFFQTSGNGTRRIRVEAHCYFISKRPLTLKVDLVPHFFQFQLQLHFKLALEFVNFVLLSS